MLNLSRFREVNTVPERFAKIFDGFCRIVERFTNLLYPADDRFNCLHVGLKHSDKFFPAFGQ